MNFTLFAVSCWAMLYVGMVSGALGPLLIPISDTFHLNLAQTAFPVALYGVGFFTGNLLVALLWKIQRARQLLVLSTLFTSLMLISVTLFDTFPLLLVFLFLLGITVGVVTTCVNSLFSEVSGRERAGSLNWLHIFVGIGAVTSPLLVGVLLDYTEKWYLIFLIIAMVSFPVSIFFLQSGLYRRIARSQESKPSYGRSPTRPTSSSLFWPVAVGMFLYVGLQVSFTSWTPVFLVRVKGLSSPLARYSVSIFWLSMTTGRFLFGKFFHRSDLPPFLAIGSLVAAAFTSLTFSINHTVLLIVLVALSGLSLSSFYPNMLALGANTFPGNVGFITGSLDASATIGSALLPWMIGPISEWLGFERGIFVVPVLFLGLAVLFFYYPSLLKKAVQPQVGKLPKEKL